METIISRIDMEKIHILQDIMSDKEALDIIDKASDILRNGGLVAFPTETVYGLGGDALDAEASGKIYRAKGRPSDNPLIVHIAEEKALYDIAAQVPDVALKLSQAFWPGPLTMILKKQDKVPDSITGGLNSVAIRMPSNIVAMALIKKSGVYVAAPSANTSGRPSPTTAAHVEEDLSGKIDMIIDGGPVDIGLESTIVDLTEEVPVILRPGYITKEMLEAVVGHVETDKGIREDNNGEAPKAPGMKYRHYAPCGKLTIVEAENGDYEKAAAVINSMAQEKMAQGYKVGILTTDENKNFYDCDAAVMSVGNRREEISIASHLYAALREFDNIHAEYIYAESFSRENVGQAIMNRLMKAAGGSIIKV